MNSLSRWTQKAIHSHFTITKNKRFISCCNSCRKHQDGWWRKDFLWEKVWRWGLWTRGIEEIRVWYNEWCIFSLPFLNLMFHLIWAASWSKWLGLSLGSNWSQKHQKSWSETSLFPDGSNYNFLIWGTKCNLEPGTKVKFRNLGSFSVVMRIP